jgi:hypothetical protein
MLSKFNLLQYNRKCSEHSFLYPHEQETLGTKFDLNKSQFRELHLFLSLKTRREVRKLVLFYQIVNGQVPGIDFTKSRKSKINRKCYRKCHFQAFDWLKFTLTTDLSFKLYFFLICPNLFVHNYPTLQMLIPIQV